MTGKYDFCELISQDGSSLIRCKSELTILQAAAVKEVFIAAIATANPIQIDLQEVQALDVAFLQLLYSCQQSAVQEGLDFELVALSSECESLVALSGFPFKLAAGL
ncbi:STAS domain-containing protein [Oceanicoccus sagamiensis]|uniref:STAS domain-containing protein n=1 Tax=Oceanicoccus sagamiensis TaxID=716816 RepID=A0A1X9N998_9GAMM|nr:STAS domain-containing protein [Oceanicoccus sagamiensis]ARN74658.1 hypothetical protein BST96_11305 [Oceanicoccus sagamiensis]